MKKASNIMHILSVIVEAIFVMLGIPLILFGISSFPTDLVYTDSLLVLLMHILPVLLPAIIKVIMVSILLGLLRKKSKSIVAEIIVIMMFCGFFFGVDSLVRMSAVSVLSVWKDADFIALYGAGGSYVQYAEFLHIISNTLLLLGAAFGIAYKKCVFPKIEE